MLLHHWRREMNPSSGFSYHDAHPPLAPSQLRISLVNNWGTSPLCFSGASQLDDFSARAAKIWFYFVETLNKFKGTLLILRLHTDWVLCKDSAVWLQTSAQICGCLLFLRSLISATKNRPNNIISTTCLNYNLQLSNVQILYPNTWFNRFLYFVELIYIWTSYSKCYSIHDIKTQVLICHHFSSCSEGKWH